MSLLTKLKDVGVKTEDLLDIYILFIRSCTEYCAAVFHSRLTLEQSYKLERIQKVCLRIILGEMYVDYESALEMCGLTLLSERREDRCLSFSLKCVKHPRNKRLYPLTQHKNDAKNKEKFTVNFAGGEAYKNLTIPYC